MMCSDFDFKLAFSYQIFGPDGIFGPPPARTPLPEVKNPFNSVVRLLRCRTLNKLDFIEDEFLTEKFFF